MNYASVEKILPERLGFVFIDWREFIAIKSELEISEAGTDIGTMVRLSGMLVHVRFVGESHSTRLRCRHESGGQQQSLQG